MAVTVSRAPICAGEWWSEEGGGLATPGLSERPEPRASVPHGVPFALSSTGLFWATEGRAWSPPGHTLFPVRAEDRPWVAPAPTPADLGSGAPSPDAPAARLPR